MSEHQHAFDMYKQGHSIRTIADALGRSYGFIHGVIEASDDPVVQEKLAKLNRYMYGANPAGKATATGLDATAPRVSSRPSRSGSEVPPVRQAPEEIPVEAANINQYIANRPDEPRIALRREAKLVQHYVTWLGHRGETAVRHRIPIPGGGHLYTDLYNTTTDELLEAKASADRANIRTGLGQVLDYSRFIALKSRALLLPTQPSADLADLLQAYNVQAVWQDAGEFKRSDDAAPVTTHRWSSSGSCHGWPGIGPG